MRGKNAESLAREYLENLGYQHVKTRMRNQAGEIDLIMLNGNTLVLIEVKQRKVMYDSMHSVSLRQWQRIYDAGMVFLAENEEYLQCDMRVDAIFIAGDGDIVHIDNVSL